MVKPQINFQVDRMASTDLEKQLFLAALDLATPAEREAYLRGACGDDAELLERLRLLVAMHEQSQGPLDQTPTALEPTQMQPATEALGGEIGPYKLLQRLGEGGMGVVYMADQLQPVKRRVALKVIKPGLDSQQIISRFEAERQALSLMDHPNIAKVLDAGATATNRPYFVMELVKGRPITQYCDEQRLPAHERLELFYSVCQAIQHAHQKGIIHRDIKPSNVLVAEYDGRPVVKVIDFGIAKAISQSLTDRTMFTEFGAVVGTFEYMSPEQARFNQLDIDTRSDIYSLGVLLYELLAGSPPLDRDRLRSSALDEILRIIREEDPPRLSAKLSSSAALPSIAANRRADPARLSALFRGELDWIAMKALEKDRSRRYESASSLALDVRRFLNDEPVQACPPSASYRVRKFVRRHKAGFLTTILVVVALLAGLLGTTWQAYVASRERDRAIDAEQLSRERLEESRKNFVLAVTAVDRLYDRLEQRIANEPQLTEWQKEMLDTALEYYQTFAAARSDDAQLLNRVARAYRRVGEIQRTKGNWPAAVEALEESVRRSQTLAAADKLQNPAELAEAQLKLADALAKVAKPDTVETAFVAALESSERLLAKNPEKPGAYVRVALTHMARGNARHEWGKYAEAEEDLRQATEILSEALRKFASDVDCQAALCKTRITRAANFVRLHQPEQQEAEERAALQLVLELLNRRPESVEYREQAALVESNLSATLLTRGKRREGLELLRSAVTRYEELVRDFPTRDPLRAGAALAFGNYALVLRRAGESPEVARRYQARAHAERQRLAQLSPENLRYQREYANSLMAVSADLYDQQRFQEATDAMRQAVSILEEAARRFPEDVASRDLLTSHLANLGLTLRKLKNYEQSEACLRQAIDQSQWLQTHAPKTPRERSRPAMLWDNLASTLEKLGRFGEALDYRRQAVRWMRELPPEVATEAFSPEMRAMLQANLAFSLHTAGEYREALEAARSALAASPGHSLARGLTAEILANCPDATLREPNQALEVATPLLSVSRSAAYGAGICGIAHFRLDDWTAAKKHLETAVRDADGADAAWDTVVQFYLAATLQKLGEIDRAKTVLQAALERAQKLPPIRRDLEEARNLARKLIDGPAESAPQGG